MEPVLSLDQVAPAVVDMRAEWRQRVNELTDQLLGRLRPCGGFTPSQGRPFHDGLTCSGLLLARPYLNPELQKRCDEAVKRTLDLWWQGMRLDGETGLWNFPEPVPARPVVDYPEISATLLWPTVQYADGIKTKLTDAWCYTMYTWFAYVPAFTLPNEDIYRIWWTLEQERWWEYGTRSRQLAYDFAHAMAVARYIGIAEALAKRSEFENTPFGYDSYDETPAHALMAYAWLAPWRRGSDASEGPTVGNLS